MKGDIEEQEVNSGEMSDIRKDNRHLKQPFSDLSLKNNMQAIL